MFTAGFVIPLSFSVILLLENKDSPASLHQILILQEDSFSRAASSTSNPWLLWVHEMLQTAWSPVPRVLIWALKQCSGWELELQWQENLCLKRNVWNSATKRQPTVNLAGRVWTESHEHVVQPFHGWFLSFPGHNKSPSKPVKRHSTDSVNNDFSCLANFWCSQHQSRGEGNKTWSCWNPALPRPDVCLPGLWAVA